MRYLILALTLSLYACSGENSWPGDDQEMGGIWVGPDYVLFVAEDGRSIWWDPVDDNFGEGSTTTKIDDVSLSFNMRGPGGPGPAVCEGNGTIAGRQSMTMTIECVIAEGDTFSIPQSTLAYDTIYNRDSSMATIAGLYDVFENGTEILDINEDGTLFSQDAVTECHTNGRVGIIDPNYNLYDLSATLTECGVGFEDLNELTSSGFVVLDNESVPGSEYLIYVGISENGGEIFGVWFEALRL